MGNPDQETVERELSMTAKGTAPDRAVYDLKGKRVFVAGHKGMVGAALLRRLAREGCSLLLASRREVDLTRQNETERWFQNNRPDAVIVAAARVGGILANATAPADFLFDNLLIAANTIGCAYACGTERLVFLGSSCIYPRDTVQPIPEEALLTGPLEATNDAYAIAKIAGIKLCDAYARQHGADFVSVMPCNLYGPGDNFDLTTSHVLPALIRKAHEAKIARVPTLTIWGSGTPRREFLHVDDCAAAVVHAMKFFAGPGHINAGAGQDLPIRELASLVAEAVGYRGQIVCDTSKPDGTPQKLLDCRRMSALGWSPSIALPEGIRATYRWYLEHAEKLGSAA